MLVPTALAALLALLPSTLAATKPYCAPARASAIADGRRHLGEPAEPICGKNGSAKAKCQTLLVNSINDFCLWGGQKPKEVVGEAEPYVVGWCLKDTHGARLFPSGTIKAAHMLRTPYFIQITGRADFAKINIDASDETGDGGGELDPHGADGFGNPIGGVMFSRAFNSFSGDPTMAATGEWQMFLEHDRFCVRMCNPTISRDLQKAYCPHRYDEVGCEFNEPANYASGFDSCIADVGLPPGLYPPPGSSASSSSFSGWSTWSQGIEPTPSAHPPPKSSSCTTYSKLTYTTYAKASTSTKASSSTKKTTAATATQTKTSSSTKKSSTSKPTATSTKKSTASTKKSSTTKKSTTKAKRDAIETQFVRRVDF